MVRTNQGGSILGFVIVGIVLALVLLGGAYFIRNNLAPATDGTTAEETETSDSEGFVDSDEPSSEQGGEDEDRTTIAPGVPTDNEEAAGVDEFVGRTSEHDLPQTGASDTVLAGLALGGIVGASVAYIRSRRLSVSL